MYRRISGARKVNRLTSVGSDVWKRHGGGPINRSLMVSYSTSKMAPGSSAGIEKRTSWTPSATSSLTMSPRSRRTRR